MFIFARSLGRAQAGILLVSHSLAASSNEGCLRFVGQLPNPTLPFSIHCFNLSVQDSAKVGAPANFHPRSLHVIRVFVLNLIKPSLGTADCWSTTVLFSFEGGSSSVFGTADIDIGLNFEIIIGLVQFSEM